MTTDMAGLLCMHYLDRPASDAERVAMEGQMERDKKIALHPFGRDGGLFTVEPATFDAVMIAGMDRP